MRETRIDSITRRHISASECVIMDTFWRVQTSASRSTIASGEVSALWTFLLRFCCVNRTLGNVMNDINWPSHNFNSWSTKYKMNRVSIIVIFYNLKALQITSLEVRIELGGMNMVREQYKCEPCWCIASIELGRVSWEFIEFRFIFQWTSLSILQLMVLTFIFWFLPRQTSYLVLRCVFMHTKGQPSSLNEMSTSGAPD